MRLPAFARPAPASPPEGERGREGEGKGDDKRRRGREGEGEGEGEGQREREGERERDLPDVDHLISAASRDLCKRPVSKEAYASVKRGLKECQKRSTTDLGAVGRPRASQQVFFLFILFRVVQTLEPSGAHAHRSRFFSKLCMCPPITTLQRCKKAKKNHHLEALHGRRVSG
jgi:hypothetical protein